MKIGFDFSGTLANDMSAAYTASRKVVAGLGATMPPFDVWKASGCANMSEFLAYFRIPAALPEFSQLMHAAWTENARAGIALPVAYAGITQLLSALKAAGHRLFLVSCCWQDVLEFEVQKLGWSGLFERVVGGLVSKRDAIAELELCVYIGDTLADMRACEGPTSFIAVGYGYGSREQFITAGVNRVLANPRELWGALGLL